VPRPLGARNRDYARTRHALAAGLAAHLLREDGAPSTLVDLAACAGVSTTTLKHYFTDRDGLYSAAMEAVRADSAQHLAAGAEPSGRPPEQSLPDLLLGTVAAWRRFGLGAVFTGALALGLGSSRRGPCFVDDLLEPFLQAAEVLLGAHVEAAELPVLTADQRRATALSLVAPVVLALLHQDSLAGSGVRPLDVEAYARGHAALVLAGLSPTG